MSKNQNQKSSYDQLELFAFKPNIEELRCEVIDIRERAEKARRSLFARQNAIEHKNQLLERELEFLKAHICKA